MFIDNLIFSGQAISSVQGNIAIELLRPEVIDRLQLAAGSDENLDSLFSQQVKARTVESGSLCVLKLTNVPSMSKNTALIILIPIIFF